MSPSTLETLVLTSSKLLPAPTKKYSGQPLKHSSNIMSFSFHFECMLYCCPDSQMSNLLGWEPSSYLIMPELFGVKNLFIIFFKHLGQDIVRLLWKYEHVFFLLLEDSEMFLLCYGEKIMQSVCSMCALLWPLHFSCLKATLWPSHYTDNE